MPRTLRLKMAREYLKMLEKTGEPKEALLEMHKRHGIRRSSIYNYVKELRNGNRL